MASKKGTKNNYKNEKIEKDESPFFTIRFHTNSEDKVGKFINEQDNIEYAMLLRECFCEKNVKWISEKDPQFLLKMYLTLKKNKAITEFEDFRNMDVFDLLKTNDKKYSGILLEEALKKNDQDIQDLRNKEKLIRIFLRKKLN